MEYTRALPLLRLAQSPDDTAPLQPFSEGDAHVVHSLVDTIVVAYVVEDSDARSFLRWRDVEGVDLERIHAASLANLRTLVKSHLRFAPRDGFVDVVLDGKYDASLLLLDELWQPGSAVARAVAGPLFAGVGPPGSLAVGTDPSKLRSLASVSSVLVRRNDEWSEVT